MTQPKPRTQPLTLPGSSDIEVTDWFAAQFRAAMQNPLLYIPKTFETWMTDRVAVAGLDIPIGQIVGFTQYTAQFDSKQDASIETTTSATYTDLATVGPTLSGIPDGKYVFVYGCSMKISAASSGAEMTIQVNSTVPSTDADAAETQQTQFTSAASFALKTLSSGGNNTVTAKYRASSGTGSFYRRRLIGLRIGNL